jgi:GWxTD domain-containing protein
MKNKISILIFIILILPQIIYADLPAFFDCNRFLTEENNTIFEITYKVLHKDLQFEFFENKFSAQIDIKLSIANEQSKELYHKDYARRISAELGKAAIEPEGFFIDKIKAEVTPGIYEFVVEIEDLLSGDKIVWDKTLNTLDTDRLAISDLEISSFYKPDTTENLINFKRKNIIFLVNPNHLFNPEKFSSFAYYFEVYTQDTLNTHLQQIWIEVLSKNDSVPIYRKQGSPVGKFSPTSKKKVYYGTIPIISWKPGTYKMIVGVKDSAGNKLISNQEMLFIQEPEREITDAEVEADYRYVKYFLSQHDNKIYKDLDNRGRLNFIKKFWRQNDPNPITEKNELKEEIVRRHKYADEHFSHLKKGWKTDRGRIYIRRGKPEEVIEKGYEFKAKPYIIWKYYSGGKRVYIFVDFSCQGNYKLVYSGNDEKEFTNPNWEDYMGPYFNKRELE